MQIDAATLDKIKTGIHIAGSLNWTAIALAYRQADWIQVAALTAEQAAEIIKPFYPQAGVAEAIIKLIASMASGAKEQSGKPFDTKQFIEAVLAAEGIDWVALDAAMKGGNPIKAGVLFADDLAKVAAPFVPQAALASGILDALLVVGSFMQPAMQDHYDGYHWDPMWGWVANENNRVAKTTLNGYEWDPIRRGWIPETKKKPIAKGKKKK